MSRWSLMIIVLSSCTFCGCLQDGRVSITETLGWKQPTPRAPRMSPAALQTAERVESLGRKIMVQNTFPGIDPLFHTVGVSEPMLFHRGSAELFISEGLVARCQTEEELAAVLCSELGQMKAEKQSAQRVGRDTEPFPEIGKDAPARVPTPVPPVTDATDPQQAARELMTGAGFDPAALDRVEAMLKDARKNNGLHKQMAGSAAAPVWTK